MNIYLMLIINFIFFNLLSFMEFNLLIEKVNLLTILNIGLLYINIIYKRNTSISMNKLNPSIVLIPISLIIYNSIIFDTFLLSISIILFILFFIFDNITDPIKVDSYREAYTAQHKEKMSSEDTYTQDEDTMDYTRFNDYWRNNTDSQSDTYENEEETIDIIDLELEMYLVLLGLNFDYNLSELKTAYKVEAVKNHPDKFSQENREEQTIIMQEINAAKKYLEARL